GADIGRIGKVAEEVAQLRVAFEGQRVLTFRPVEADGRHPAVIADLPEEMLGLVILEGAQVPYHRNRAHPANTSPPAMAIAWPLIESAAGDANHRMASATSSGLMSRPCGLFLVNSVMTS